MTEVFVANKGKRHGALVRRNYPKSRVRTLSSLLSNPWMKKSSKTTAKKRAKHFSTMIKRKRDSKGKWLSVSKSNPRKSRKRVHHKLVNPRVRHTGGTVKMAKATRRRRRRRNVWFDDKKGHRKASRKGWGRRKAKARRIRRQRLKALAKARSAKRRKASTRKHRKATRASRSNPPARRRRRRRNTWVNNAEGHAKAARKGWRRRKYGKRKAARRTAKARSRKARRKSRKGVPRGYHKSPGGTMLIANPRRRRRSGRRSNPRKHRKVSRRRNPVIGGALAIPRKLPLVGQFFNMAMIKAAGGIGLGMLVGGGFGNMLYTFASSKLTFLADYPKIFKPVCILAAGAGAAVVMNKLGWRNMSKYVLLGAGAAVAVDLISPIFATVMSNIPGLSDYVQLADYVQLQDQAAVERGMLGGYNDYVQLPGVAGLPGFSDQAAVEAGLL